ncbi:MAG: bifunctional sugar-1-phosphate nucleotidylyltransferase/acetyltransferase [Spirochaetota bacterium]
MDISAIILAAGESSRFWPLASNKHKSMYHLLGKPALSFTLEGLKNLGVKKAVIVKQPDDESIENYFGNGERIGIEIKYAIQEKPLGMGNAVLSAEKEIDSDYFFVLNADQVNAEDLGGDMLNLLNSRTDIDSVLASQKTTTPENYGILEIENEKAKSIEEKPAPGTEKSNQMVIGIYLLAKRFLDTLKSVETRQYSYEEALGKYMTEYDTVGVNKFEDIPEITIKFPWHLFNLNKYLMDKFLKASYISEKARISPTAIILGNVHIEDNVRVFEHAVIKGPAYIREGAIIGNNSLIRDYSYIGENTIVGYSTEIKHSILFDNVETHKNFIGDSIVDEYTGFGAGTITANRRLDRENIKSRIKGKNVDSGFTFLGNVIGMNVHTGIQVGLMPGVKIGNNSNIGALTNVSKDVEDDTFVYSKQDLIIRKYKK